MRTGVNKNKEILLRTESISYSAGEKSILSDVSFEVKMGERLGISGESGSGKTTLAKILTGILSSQKGIISLNTPKPRILMLFQNSGELIHPFRKAGDLIEEAVKLSGIKEKSLIRSEVLSIISLLNISPELLTRKGSQLSGGEQQRIGLARLLALKPDILIVDEPFSSQDPDSTENLISLLNAMVELSGLTLICISHDFQSLCRVSDEIIILKDGIIIEKNPVENILSRPQHPYTEFLIKASAYNLELEDFSLL